MKYVISKVLVQPVLNQYQAYPSQKKTKKPNQTKKTQNNKNNKKQTTKKNTEKRKHQNCVDVDIIGDWYLQSES